MPYDRLMAREEGDAREQAVVAVGRGRSSSEASSARPRSRPGCVVLDGAGGAAGAGGLAAFESAPCYRELLERERSEGP